MCCVIYYIYLKLQKYFTKNTNNNKLKEIDEFAYNAKQLNEYVRNKERAYWCSYTS